MRAGLSAVFSRRLAPVALGALVVSLAAASVAAGAASLPPTLTVTQTTAGLNSTASGGFEPPDVTLAAGPGFVVELVNLAGRIWRTDIRLSQEEIAAELQPEQREEFARVNKEMRERYGQQGPPRPKGLPPLKGPGVFGAPAPKAEPKSLKEGDK